MSLHTPARTTVGDESHILRYNLRSPDSMALHRSMDQSFASLFMGLYRPTASPILPTLVVLFGHEGQVHLPPLRT